MRTPLRVALLLVLAAAVVGAAEPATWDGFLDRPPQNRADADRMSLALNGMYREALRHAATPAIADWIAEATGHARENERRARRALAGASLHGGAADDAAWRARARRFVTAYAAEQRRLAMLWPRNPSEIHVYRSETAGWDLPDRTLALTFDDGPHPARTRRVMALLHARGIPAAFFVLGRSLQAARDAHAMPDYRGFAVGIHTWSHPYLPELGADGARQQLVRTAAEMRRAGLGPVRFFRAPFGARGPRELKMVEAMGLRSVLWNMDSQDWQGDMQRRPSRIAGRAVALALLQRRGILLMHDTQPQTAGELKQVLDVLQRAGFRFTSRF